MDSTLACLAAWLPQQRWYAGGGHEPELRLVATWDDALGPDDARAFTVLVEDARARSRTVYQVPLVDRAGDLRGGPDEVGRPRDGRVLIDGTRDPLYTDALLDLVARGAAPRPGSPVRGVTPQTESTVPSPVETRVLSGEQSNTSIIYRFAQAPHLICKVFRIVEGGVNPDIELTTALSDAGSLRVPPVRGTAVLALSSGPEQDAALALAEEFLDGSEDAWRVALRAAANDEDFAASARALGAATADVHGDLARVFPTVAVSPAGRDRAAQTWLTRLDLAVAEVPELAHFRDGIEHVYAAARDRAWPAMQRIHGDYHLGQVLDVPGRGWVLLDFEGEPLRTLSERVQPDSALRDLAGMLRSFDYVAATVGAAGDRDVTAWATAAREGFLAGYLEQSGLVPDPAVLDAYELDKAVYETLYESSHRPDWVHIPLGAVRRLTRGR